MKNTFLIKLLGILVFVAFIFAACTEDISDKRLDPKLSTANLENLTSDSVIVVGYVIASGGGLTERGVCWDVAENPTISSNTVVYTGDVTEATFRVMLNEIDRLSTYHARAYAINDKGTVYGEDITIVTPAALPTLTDIATPTIAYTTDNGVTATTGINIPDDGGDGDGPDETANITARGVVYGFYSKPTVDSTKTQEGTGDGSFNSLATNLRGNKTYYLRAYATNSIGTTYSNEVSFTTTTGYATCTTLAPSNITKTTATLTGVITYNGGGTISEQGFCYGLTENPTTADTKVTVTPVKDTITASIEGLDVYTSYHVRAYVINEKGTNYGSDISFTTLPNITKFWVVGSYNGWDNSDNALYIISTESNPEAQGYIDFTDITYGFKLTTDHSWDNAHTFGDDGTNSGKLANPGDNISLPSVGYYLVKANASDMTYSTTKTTWGVIGSFTASGWGSQIDMTYNSTLQVFSLALTLESGNEYKFRGTSDWSINYGCSAADGSTLDAGGNNIVVDVTGDYALTLDLSHPNEYTYSANRWGVIGGFNGWGSSVAMTWDATNEVFTTTITTTADNTEFKFRANDGWGVNLGGSLDALTQGGDNLVIATAGTYTITLDPWNKVATVTPAK